MNSVLSMTYQSLIILISMGKELIMSILNSFMRKIDSLIGENKGVHVSHNKSTQNMQIVEMPAPSKVILPLRQHIGAPCIPLVKVGDYVKIGQKIADNEGLCAPIHASVSGTVKKIADYKTTMGPSTTAIEIASDGLMEIDDSVKPIEINNYDDFIEAIRQSGYVGLGGAGFPTFFKLKIPTDKKIDKLIINAAECEPYITVDYRKLMEDKENILEGISLITHYLNIDEVILGIEDNKQPAIKLWKELFKEDQKIKSKKSIKVLPSRYPQGAEKVLIQMTTGRKVQPGKLPSDVSCVVMNISTIAGIGAYFLTGMPLVRRSLTCDGTSINNPKNVSVPLGTSIKDLIEFCGGFSKEPDKILMGGPMMGIALDTIDQPVLKYNNAVLALSSDEIQTKEIGPCIRCGNCVSVCPMSLVPTTIKKYASTENHVMLNKYSVMVCMECGSCAYACPANIPLVQYLRLGKSIVRKAGQKK